MSTDHSAIKPEEFKVGLFGVGLEAYWEQFEGLQDRLKGYLQVVHDRLQASGFNVVDAGMVDSIDKSIAAGRLFRQEEVDLIFIYISTYALSSTALPVVQRTKVPVIILNLSPGPAIDYASFNQLKDRTRMTGEWLAWCSGCSAPEMSNVFQRAGISFHLVTGMLQNDDECWNEIKEWGEAAKVAHVMRNNRLGCLGHYYSGMLDVYSDLTQHYAQFGGHMELIEIEELATLRKQASKAAITERVGLFYEQFEVQPDCELAQLEKAAATSLALDLLVEKYQLGSLAYYYKGSGNEENAEVVDSIILGNSLLTARGIPVAGEYEIKNAQAMKILDSFGAGGSFTEYYGMDYNDDVVLMGHDGPGHVAIAEGKTKVRPLYEYHGKTGSGLSIEMSVKYGAVTLLSVAEDHGGKLKLLVCEAESVAGPVLEIGNTNSRYKFASGARKFVNEWNARGPAHHCAVGVGHVASKIEKLGEILGMKVERIG